MIYVAGNQVKKLYKGDEEVSRVFKGDDLIYRDIEVLYGFKFTIDTTLTPTGAHTSTDKSILIRMSSNYGGSQGYIIKWGDGTENTYSGQYDTMNHTYSAHGIYQITIMPSTFNYGGEPREGWLSGFKVDGTNQREKIVSFDTLLPRNSFVFAPQNSSSQSVDAIAQTQMGYTFSNTKNLQSMPDNFFKFAKVKGDGTILSWALSNMFQYCGYNTGFCPVKAAAVFIDKLKSIPMTAASHLFSGFFSYTGSSADDTIPEDLFTGFNFQNVTDFSNFFQNTFSNSFTNSTKVTIPSNLFSGFDTSNGVNFSGMFNGTFNYFGNKTTAGAGIPSGLFSSINTTNATSVENMFSGTFFTSFAVNTAAVIPADLFATITPNGGNVKAAFSKTFNNYAPNSTVLSIPATIFANFDTTGCVDLSNLFQDTFNMCGTKNPAATIPSNIFSAIDTSSATNVSNLFNATFQNSCSNSTVATIPADIFSGMNFSNAVNMNATFSSTFRSLCSKNTTATIPANLFHNIDTSSVTSASQIFSYTFSGVFTGSTVATVPSKMFKDFDFSHVTEGSGMFNSTFAYSCSGSTVATIPADVFDGIDTSSMTSMGSFFSFTFQECCKNNPSATIPATLFNGIDTSLNMSFGSFLSGTFAGCCSKSTVADIPQGIFDFLDMSSAAGQYCITQMFDSTFNKFTEKATVTIPSDLFSHVIIPAENNLKAWYVFRRTFTDISYGTNIPATLFSSINTSMANSFNYMFEGLFSGYGRLNTTPITLPSNLFSTIDTSNSIEMYYMFSYTFQNCPVDRIPQGLFGNIIIPQGLADGKYTGIFSYTFGWNNYRTDSNGIILEDAFYGMQDFSWLRANNAHSMVQFMFKASSQQVADLHLTGSASTILQHFNFTPTNDTGMFEHQIILTDYATINNNWK